MAEQVKVPVVGKTNKKTVYIFGGAAVVIVGIALYRHTKATNAANAAAQSVANAGTTSIDPATGYAYGSPEDSAALSTQDNYSYPSSGYGGGSGILGGGNYYSPGSGGPTGFLDNAQWSQAAVAAVTGTGAPSTDVSAAIGQYITGHPPSNNTYASYINQAIALVGYPPVPGPNGYPPGIANVPPSSTPTPPPAPLPAPQIGKVNSTTFNIGPVPGATRYHIQMDGKAWKDVLPNALTIVAPRGHEYRIAAYDSHGTLSTNYAVTRL